MAIQMPRYRVDRPIYSFEDLSQDYIEEDLNFDLLKKIKCDNKVRRVSFLSVLEGIFPFPFIMASYYSWKYIVNDIVAGLTMMIFSIPQGMAYGLLSGLQPINGLYTGLVSPLVYLFFGTSRHLSLGTFVIISLLSSVPLDRELHIMMGNKKNLTFNESIYGATNLEDLKLQISIATTLLTGIFQFFMGVFQLGCIVNYVSHSMIGGFTTATAFHILISQLGPMLGYDISRYSGIGELPFKTYMYAINLPEINWVTFGISSVCFIILMLFSELINPWFRKKVYDIAIPIQLILVIISAVISHRFSFAKHYNVTIVGKVPNGLPMPVVPNISIWPSILVDALILAIFGFISNSAIAKLYASQFSYKVNYSNELVGYGLSNVACSFFRCTISSVALARTAVVVQVGMKSQLATLINCLLMVPVLLFVGPFFEPLPNCILSTIIVATLKLLIVQFKDVPELFRLSKFDFDVWIVSFMATMLLNIPFGLVVGFIFSLLTTFIRFHNPKSELLGQLPHTNIYKNIKAYKDAVQIPGIRIFRYDSPVYFANAEHFKEKLHKKCDINLQRMGQIIEIMPPEKSDDFSEDSSLISKKYDMEIDDIKDKVKFIIVDFSSINYIDNVSVGILDEIYKACREYGIFLYFAEPNKRIRKMLAKAEFAGEDLNRIMFVTIHDAILRILAIMMTLERM